MSNVSNQAIEQTKDGELFVVLEMKAVRKKSLHHFAGSYAAVDGRLAGILGFPFPWSAIFELRHRVWLRGAAGSSCTSLPPFLPPSGLLAYSRQASVGRNSSHFLRSSALSNSKTTACAFACQHPNPRKSPAHSATVAAIFGNWRFHRPEAFTVERAPMNAKNALRNNAAAIELKKPFLCLHDINCASAVIASK